MSSELSLPRKMTLILKHLRVQLQRDKKAHQLGMHQEEYISFLLQEYGLLDYYPVHLPTDPKMPFGDPMISYPEVMDLQPSYLKLIRELIYNLSVNTCPDIACIVNSLAQFNANPTSHHFTASNRVL